ncbi:alkyl hydroperoxide reductase [Virgibacillus profundi]|uniref:Alkyl hydroperoxide reductase n=1 Tax=Virgibacillus profundi TaxID=2024555 RepID=A0A2A2ID03_9BACI|nr:redoxin domain-containing protein [Virgibacillus profundi]PAV29609.1 alkyl hydroperoxide reductase [Virgibacillus profundi]PXY53781.1 alkyl hydroperoxide reductase [Virgibacillus profundi]
MKKGIFIVIIVGMIGWAIYDFIDSSENSSSGENNGSGAADEIGIAMGDIAPDFELETLEGEPVRLSDYRGSRVMLNFWATWCPPCRAEIPDMQKLYDNKDVTILAVNMAESQDTVTKFVKEFEMTFPVPMDVESEVMETYQVQAYPTSYMIDSNGRIQFIRLGAMNYDLMVQELEKME